MLTVICPVFNESKYIKDILDFCIQSKPVDKEIIFIDGNSTDDTCAIIQRYITSNSNITLLHNAKRYVSYALNMALEKAKGDVVVRIDAHTVYASDYFEKILEVFLTSGADIVGGPMRIAEGTATQQAVGYATSTIFGIGNSSFHFDSFEGFTDSVYLGAWKKQIFSATGFFDESLKRNQDDEFHYRAKRNGFSIYQSPHIKLHYYPRATFKSLFRQYFEYGLYKPLVLRKNQSAVRWRHIIPSLFVLYLLMAIVFAAIGFYVSLIPLACYILMDVYFSLSSKKSIGVILRIAFAYPVIHIAYGAGFLLGMFKVMNAK